MIFKTIEAQDYPPGNYAWGVPITPDVSMVQVTFERIDWPGVSADNVARGGIAYSDGTVRATGLPGGTFLFKDGSVAQHSMIALGVTEERDPDSADPMASRRRNIDAAVVVLEVLQPLRTAIVITLRKDGEA